MRLTDLAATAEHKLDVQARVALLLDVARATLPALRNLPNTVRVAMDAISFIHNWNSHNGASANDLYSYANRRDESGLAFEEKSATTDSEKAAIIASTMAYYYAVWCAYMREGASCMPQDVEAVPDEAFLGTFRFAIASGAVSEEALCKLLEHYLAPCTSPDA